MSDRTAWAVEAAGLYKTYGDTVALGGVDLFVGRGERVFILGANGAGKTTLLRLLALLARPSAGTLRLDGYVAGEADTRLRRSIGFLGHQPALYPDLTARENLAFYARLYDVPAAALRIERLLEWLGLAGWRDERAGTLSRGQQQRLGLARALLHNPPLLLLDEPDTGLDAAGQALLAEIIAEPGRTVIASTHRPEAWRALGGRALVLDGGRVLRDGPLAAPWQGSGDVTPRGERVDAGGARPHAAAPAALWRRSHAAVAETRESRR